LVFGPTPVEEAVRLIQAQVDRAEARGPSVGRYAGLARLRALQGRLAEARELVTRARAGFEELGNRQQLASAIGFAGQIEYLAGNHAEAARLIRESYEAMTAIGDRSYASTIGVELGEVLLYIGDEVEVMRFATIARDTSSTDDVASQAGGRALQARVLSRRGEHDAAETLAREAAAIMGQTDYLDQHGRVLVHLARVLRDAGKADEALAAARQALALYEQKGATFYVERTQRLIDDWTG
jgi:tetratricopeptide (TPR) repeat protein